MKTIKGKQTRIITAENGIDFENKLNCTLNDLANQGFDYELRFNDSLGFCAYVIYDKETEIAETKREEYWQVGENHTCSECKYKPVPTDRRIKNVHCEHNGKLVAEGTCACEAFYEALEEAENFFKEIA